MTSFDFNPAITAGETERVASASAACPAIKESSGVTCRQFGLAASCDSQLSLVDGIPIFVLTFRYPARLLCQRTSEVCDLDLA